MCVAGAAGLLIAFSVEAEPMPASVGILCVDQKKCDRRFQDAVGRGPMRPLEADPVLEHAGLKIRDAVDRPACVIERNSSECYRFSTMHTPTPQDVVETSEALHGLGFSAFEVRLARSDDPAHNGAVLAGVRVDDLCILSYSQNFDQGGDLWAAGTLADGTCLR